MQYWTLVLYARVPDGGVLPRMRTAPVAQHLANKLKVETDASAYQLLTSLMMPQAAA
jgi:hypothetical protein